MHHSGEEWCIVSSNVTFAKILQTVGYKELIEKSVGSFVLHLGSGLKKGLSKFSPIIFQCLSLFASYPVILWTG